MRGTLLPSGIQKSQAGISKNPYLGGSVLAAYSVLPDCCRTKNGFLPEIGELLAFFYV
jgi:hypothetical protein